MVNRSALNQEAICIDQWGWEENAEGKCQEVGNADEVRNSKTKDMRDLTALVISQYSSFYRESPYNKQLNNLEAAFSKCHCGDAENSLYTTLRC